MHELVDATTWVIGEVRKRGSARWTRRGPREALPLHLLPLTHTKKRRPRRRVPSIRHVRRVKVGQRARLRGPLATTSMRALKTISGLRHMPALAMAGLAQTRLPETALRVTPHTVASVTDAASAVTGMPVAALPVALIPTLPWIGVTQASRQIGLIQCPLPMTPLTTKPVANRSETTRPQNPRVLHRLRTTQVRGVACLPVTRRNTAIVAAARTRDPVDRAMPVAAMA